MSKSNNEERRDIVNKRLSEINDKIVNPNKVKEEEEEETIINEAPVNSSTPNTLFDKFKKYLNRIGIILLVFYVLKWSGVFKSIFDISQDNEQVKVEVKVDVPANKSNKKVDLKYNFNFEGGNSIIVFGDYQTEALAIEAKEKFAQNFVEFPLTHFFLPNKSNSKEEIYQLYLGPIDGESKAKQWSKLIGEKNQVINF